jgi:hypothetical protein
MSNLLAEKSQEPMSDRTAALVGIAGCVLFWVSLFVFGAMRPEYSVQRPRLVVEGGVHGLAASRPTGLLDLERLEEALARIRNRES